MLCTECLTASDNIIVLVWHFNLTKNLLSSAGFNTVSYELLINLVDAFWATLYITLLQIALAT